MAGECDDASSFGGRLKLTRLRTSKWRTEGSGRLPALLLSYRGPLCESAAALRVPVGWCVKKKKTRALICPGLDCRKALCGRPTAVSGRLGGPRCEVSPVMESVTVEQSTAFFFLLC